MNIKACPHCAVLYDQDLRPFPKCITCSSGIVNQDRAQWNGHAWVPFVPCPVCHDPILKES